MFVPTLIMGALAIILLFIGYFRGEGQHITGIKSTINLVVEILPLLIFAFIISGMVQVLLPQETITKWVGTESGIKGIVIGSVAGGLCPGGPFVSLPIAAGLLHSGAGLATMVAFLTGWSVWAVSRLPMEIGILGWRLTLIRLASTAVFPILAGIITLVCFKGNK